MFCKHCGKQIDKDSKFCEFCGRPIEKYGSKKINLEEDEDVVYIESHDDTEFNDYDFDNGDDFNYEEKFKYRGNNKNNNNKLIMILSCIVAVLAIVFITFELDLFSTNNKKTEVLTSRTESEGENEKPSKEVNDDSQNIENIDRDNEDKKNNDSQNLHSINISNSECSSILHDSTNKNYGSTKVLDGDFSTVWSEGVSGYGNGEWIILDFDNIYTVKKIKIVNGLVNKKMGITTIIDLNH